MTGKLDILSHVRIASPCHVPWNSMHGDDRVRHCDQCKLNVYNLSAMSKEEAERLILEHEGELCLRFYQRTDGTILLRDCPRGLRHLRRRAVNVAARVLAGCAAMLVTCAALARAPGGSGGLRLWVADSMYRASGWCMLAEERLGVPKEERSWPPGLRYQIDRPALMGRTTRVFQPMPKWESLSPSQRQAVEDIVHAEDVIQPTGSLDRSETRRTLAMLQWWSRETQDRRKTRTN